ncbi:MAG TPA: glycosyltransferase [Gammaproteobacteria bacterium]|nr:glycosyltransferase [Gammaproteobacteria bacterium]
MKVAIVVPVYNHGEPLRATAARLAEFGLPVLIVDDGSDEATKCAIAEVAARYRYEAVTLPRNGGKGQAVVAGLRAAAAHGYTHAVQVDADGQHDLADLPKLLAAAKENPAALICGEPRFDASVPKARLYGRKLTAFWVAIETVSLRMPDTMCGYRVYPLAATLAIIDSVTIGRRMDFDIEIVVRLYWHNVPIVKVPTAVIYPEGGTSNFRTLADNALISKLHTKLTFGMLWRLPMLVTRRVGHALHWADLGERGGVAGMHVLFGVYRFFGRRAFTALLYPVVGYFSVAARSPRRASREYLAAIRARLVELGRPVPPQLSVFHHVLEFGNGVLDKVAMWADAMPNRGITQEDFEMLERFRKESRGGALFIGSHLGNLEMLRAVGDVQKMTVNALVFTRHSPKFNRVLAAVSPKTLERMIQVDSLGPEAVIMLRDKLASGEHVAIVGDRVSVRHKERSVRAPFMGRPAPFPEGPFILASLLECPVYLLFCLKIEGRYRVFMEPFADPLVLPRGGRQQALERAVERYAARLEAHCLLAPTQWFNFFDFWGQAGGH